MGKLIIVPTPVGNLDDITIRALNTLKSADLILAEDTRQSGKLLKHYSISTKMRSYHAYNEHAKLQTIVSAIQTNTTTALISDAGTPGISDPGFLIIRECISQDIPVECLPGPTACIPALVVSGFSTDRFCFEGFLPHKKGKQTRILNFAEEQRTIILYESPHRIAKTLQQIHELLGNKQIVIVRELSKKFEEILRGDIVSIISKITETPLKGEIVLLIEGKK